MATIRGVIVCSTCEKKYILRIGMGQEEKELHAFVCEGCGQRVAVTLNVDYKKIAAWIEPSENCTRADEEDGGTIYNLCANFPVPEELRHVDRVSLQLLGMRRLMESKTPEWFEGTHYSGGARRPDFSAEWNALARGWSLAVKGKPELARQATLAASSNFSSDYPITSWARGYISRLCGAIYGSKAAAINRVLLDLKWSQDYGDLIHALREGAEDRRQWYFDTLRDFFNGYADFGQVFFLVREGLPIEQGDNLSSHRFERTRQFYGNVFEYMGKLADPMAFIANVLAGRHHRSFRDRSYRDYVKSNNSSRPMYFQLNAPLIGIYQEYNNKLRNASHHGSIRYDDANRVVSFPSSVGSKTIIDMSYAEYIACCCRMFLQFTCFMLVDMEMNPLLLDRHQA